MQQRSLTQQCTTLKKRRELSCCFSQLVEKWNLCQMNTARATVDVPWPHVTDSNLPRLTATPFANQITVQYMAQISMR